MTMFERGRERGCTEAWVGTESDNRAARALYESLRPYEEDNCVFYLYRSTADPISGGATEPWAPSGAIGSLADAAGKLGRLGGGLEGVRNVLARRDILANEDEIGTLAKDQQRDVMGEEDRSLAAGRRDRLDRCREGSRVIGIHRPAVVMAGQRQPDLAGGDVHLEIAA